MPSQPTVANSRTERVLVDGATGYVGSHITKALRDLDHPVRCLVRSQASEKDLQILQSTGAEVVAGDLQSADLEKNAQLFDRVDTAVHTIGTVAPKRGESLENLHAEQTRTFVELCKRNQVGRIIMISSLGTSRHGQTEYHRTKWLAEEEVRRSGIDYVILRPALIIGKTFGRRNSKLVDRYLHLIEKNNSVPLIAGGGNKVQPVFIGDVVAAVVKSLQSATGATINQTLDLAGPDVVTMRQFVECLMEQVVKQKRNFRQVSPILAKVGAFFCERLQEVPLISADQIKLSLSDNVALENGLASVLDIKPTEITRALATYSVDQTPSPAPAQKPPLVIQE